MKHSLLLMLIVSGYCYGQSEFQIYSSGLIYDQPTMTKLGHIVDSLNVRFRTCDLAHPYYSFPQGKASYVSVPSKAARKLIESGISYEEYVKRFPKNILTQNLWIIKTHYTNYQEKQFIEYTGLPYGYDQQPSISVKEKSANDKTSGWVISEDGTEAFYFKKLEGTELPFNYARLVQYVDCMIDTTVQIYFPQAKGEVYQRVNESSKAYEFIAWANKFPNQPVMPDYKNSDDKNFNSLYAIYRNKFAIWDSLRIINLDKQMTKSSYWKNLLNDSKEESLATGNSDARLEFYVARYLSKEDALQLMRSRRVIGNCSQDQSPRYHAMNICKLAAETAKWDIFLRSHLDIMNDRFDRMSDGSYAWAGRKTYLKELEKLDINANDLLLGTCLRVQNVGGHHYWGSISRVGRALTDVSDKDKLEAELMTMIQPPADSILI